MNPKKIMKPRWWSRLPFLKQKLNQKDLGNRNACEYHEGP